MKLNEQISRMKGIMGLNEGQIQPVDLTAEYFIQRVPFFKTYENYSNEKTVAFQKGVYNSNVELHFGKDMMQKFVFPNFNTFSDFHYSKWTLNDKNQFVFSLKQEIIMSKPPQMDALTYGALSIATRMACEKFSYSKEFIIPDDKLSATDMDMVINEINGKLFHFEEYITEVCPANVKNPFD